MSEFQIHSKDLKSLTGASVARFLELGYMTEYPFAWTDKAWAWFKSAEGKRTAA